MMPWPERWAVRRALARFTSVGSGTRLDGAPFVRNDGTIVLGNAVELRSLPVRTHIVSGPAGRIEIGDHVRIAHGVALSAHLSIAIGEGTVIGPYAVLLDVDFHEVRDRGATGAARPITIGRNVRIGAGVVVLRGAVIGDDVTIAPHSVVGRRIPDGMSVAGVPASPVVTTGYATALRPG